jgi:hypothetical protein
LPTAALEIWVPERFARDVEAPGARSAVEERDGERWRVIRHSGSAREGESLVVSIDGLSGRQPDNPLATSRGAAVASAAALLLLAGGVALLLRLSRMEPARVTESAA